MNSQKLLCTFVALVIALDSVQLATAQQPAVLAPALPPDLASVPPDISLFVAINLTGYWSSPEAESLKRLADAHPVVPTWSFKDMQAACGVQPENIVRAAMFATGGEGTFSLATKDPYDREKVLAALAPEAAPKSAGGKSYFYSAKTKNAVYFADDRTLIIGMGHDIAGLLARPATRERNPSLDRAFDASLHGAPFVVHVGPAMIQALAAEKDTRHGPFAALANARAWQIITSLDKQLAIDLRADFNTKEEADKALPAFALVGEKLAALVPFYQSHMIPFLEAEAAQYPGAKDIAPEMNRALDAAAQGIKAMRPVSDKTSVVARIDVNSDKPVTTAVMLITLMPRGEKGKGQ